MTNSRPFLKWMGGKTRSLRQIGAALPATRDRHIEPFLGGGAVFWRYGGVDALLGDINAELIQTMTAVRDHVEWVIFELESHTYDRTHFEEVRALDRDPGLQDMHPAQVASRMIFLNKACFNGMYRVNGSGFFNVPFGRYVDPTICDAALLRACSERLQGVELRAASFEDTVSQAGDGDFIYADPPYVPVSSTSDFTSYASGGFGTAEHVALLSALRDAGERGARFLLSSSAAYGLEQRYEAEGWSVERLSVGRSISSKKDKRQPVTELLVRNFN